MEATASDFTDTFRTLSLYHGGNREEVVEEVVKRCAPPKVIKDVLMKRIRFSRPSIPTHQIQVRRTKGTGMVVPLVLEAVTCIGQGGGKMVMVALGAVVCHNK